MVGETNEYSHTTANEESQSALGGLVQRRHRQEHQHEPDDRPEHVVPPVRSTDHANMQVKRSDWDRPNSELELKFLLSCKHEDARGPDSYQRESACGWVEWPHSTHARTVVVGESAIQVPRHQH